jgi:plastocyanin
MNKAMIAIVAILLLGGGYYFMKGNAMVAPAAETPSTQVASANTVEIKNFAYSPATLTVKVGDTVTWTNKDIAGHSATADDGSFDTGVLSQGESGSFTFTKAGTFGYFCTPHPNIKGTIIVE